MLVTRGLLADGAPVAVVTSAPRELAVVRMRAASVPVPEVLVAAEDVERGKPDPQGYRLAADRLGVPIADCVVFEDAEAGLRRRRRLRRPRRRCRRPRVRDHRRPSRASPTTHPPPLLPSAEGHVEAAIPPDSRHDVHSTEVHCTGWPQAEEDRRHGHGERRKRLPRRPASSLAERWTTVDGVDVFYRESTNPPDAPAMMHVHGFGLSGRYLLPTAERLADDFHTLVPDLPGFGRSGKSSTGPRHPGSRARRRALPRRPGHRTVTLVGNSMGCPVILEFAHHYPERLDRAVLVSPAGGIYNQPLRRAVGQLARDGGREPARMVRVATPDYLRFGVPSTMKMFRALTQYPSLARLLDLHIPTLVVLGDRDPLMPHHERVREIAAQTDNHVLLVRIEGAAHAINFSHSGELAHLIR